MPTQATFLADVLNGLKQQQKSIPPKYFYDGVGSRLYTQITHLDEYYLTRTETAILNNNRQAIAQAVGHPTTLLEFGGGSGRRTRILLAAIESLTDFAPIDVSQDQIAQTGAIVSQLQRHLRIHPIIGDFLHPPALPETLRESAILGYFPGSTIGNLDRQQAIDFLQQAKNTLGQQGKLLIGVDMVKDLQVLLPAYADSQQITAAFNLNLLARINRELDGDFKLDRFSHEARFNTQHSRVEMHLVAKQAQRVSIGDQAFEFSAGESIHTENSHKYTVDLFTQMAVQSGWQIANTWADQNDYYRVFLLSR